MALRIRSVLLYQNKHGKFEVYNLHLAILSRIFNTVSLKHNILKRYFTLIVGIKNVRMSLQLFNSLFLQIPRGGLTAQRSIN